jgi:hypothetical protein
MGKYYVLEPEVAGGLGVNTITDRSVHPRRVSRLHYHFEGWLGDELLESFPCYILTENLARQIEGAGLKGAVFDELEVTVSEEFRERYPGRPLPRFLWLKPIGVAGEDDFGVGPDHRMVVSDRALQLILATGPSALNVSDFATARA